MSCFNQYLPLLQFIGTAAAVAAIILSWSEIRRSRRATQSLVMQSVVAQGNDLIAIPIQHPQLARQTSLAPEGLQGDDAVRGVVLARAFLCYCENILAQRSNFPPGQFDLFRAMMEDAFREGPMLHDLVRERPRLWTPELQDIAEQNPLTTGKQDDGKRTARQ